MRATLPPALAASIIAGVSWIAVLASLNVSAQVALPEWVRGRGLAIFVTVFFGAMTLGSAIWGQVAGMLGLPTAHFMAAAGALVAIPLTWRWKLQTGAGIDLTPSMHWPAPVVSHEIEHDRGPVLVTVEYRIDPRRPRRRFSPRSKSSATSAGATAPMPGASSRMPPRRDASSRRFWWNPGSSTCASMSA